MGNGEREKRFGAALGRMRQRAGLTQAALAEEIGSKQSTLSSWERGEFEPPPDAVFSMEKALECKGGALSRLLGYVPLDTDSQAISVEEAIAVDPALDEYRRELLIGIYETFRSSPSM